MLTWSKICSASCKTYCCRQCHLRSAGIARLSAAAAWSRGEFSCEWDVCHQGRFLPPIQQLASAGVWARGESEKRTYLDLACSPSFTFLLPLTVAAARVDHDFWEEDKIVRCVVQHGRLVQRPFSPRVNQKFRTHTRTFHFQGHLICKYFNMFFYMPTLYAKTKIKT